jgi:hypothetical protein
VSCKKTRTLRERADTSPATRRSWALPGCQDGNGNLSLKEFKKLIRRDFVGIKFKVHHAVNISKPCLICPWGSLWPSEIWINLGCIIKLTWLYSLNVELSCCILLHCVWDGGYARSARSWGCTWSTIKSMWCLPCSSPIFPNRQPNLLGKLSLLGLHAAPGLGTNSWRVMMAFWFSLGASYGQEFDKHVFWHDF